MSDGVTEMRKRERKCSQLTKQLSRAEQLVNDHWKYVGRHTDYLIHGKTYTSDEVFKIMEFTYKTSGIHFYGHAVEDVNNDKT
jgi:hypothetical protein